MKFSELLALSEASTGYVGGVYVDEMPHLTLEECVSGLDMAILENQLDLISSNMNENDALVESTISAMQTGDNSRMMDLVEMSFQDIKNKIKKVFDAIIKFLKTIIAKLGMQIDKIRMNGHQLYTKYKDSKLLKRDFKDLTFNGYEFKATKLFPAASQYDTPEGAKNLINAATGKNVSPEDFLAAMKNAKSGGAGEEGVANTKPYQEKIDNLKDLSRSERIQSMAKVLTGMKTAGEDWVSDVKKELYGDKVDIKYGSGVFTLTWIAARLEKPDELSAIKNEYEKVENAVTKYRDTLQKQVDEFDKEHGDIGDDKDKKNRSNYLSMASAYFNEYIQFINDAYGTINKVKNLKYNYEKSKNDQAKAMFSKLLSGGAAKKDNNDASDFEDVEYFEIEL